MESNWTIPTPEEIRQRATEVRKTWSPSDRLARLTLPPDSILLRRSTPQRDSSPMRLRRSVSKRLIASHVHAAHTR